MINQYSKAWKVMGCFSYYEFYLLYGRNTLVLPDSYKFIHCLSDKEQEHPTNELAS